ncbi:hypothetical protein ACHAWF_016553 [Thalassiosira exigua]
MAAFAAAPSSAAVPPPVVPRLILLDRDGVVNEDVGSPGVIQPRQLRLTPGASKAIGRLRRRGCHVSLVTNQSSVGKGIISEVELDTIHEHLNDMLLQIDADAQMNNMYICTSTRQDDDMRMKPGPGMILEARHDFCEGSESCVLIGDTLTDMMAAKAGGVGLRILVKTGYGRGLMGYRSAPPFPALVTEMCDEMHPNLAQALPFVYANNLSGAVDWLLNENENGMF